MAKPGRGFLLYDARTQKVWLYSVNLPNVPQARPISCGPFTDKPSAIGTFHHGLPGETAHLLVKKVLSFAGCKDLCRQP